MKFYVFLKFSWKESWLLLRALVEIKSLQWMSLYINTIIHLHILSDSGSKKVAVLHDI